MSFLPNIKTKRIEEKFKRLLIYSDGLVEAEDSGITKDNVEELLDITLLEKSVKTLEKIVLEDDTTIVYLCATQP